MLLQVGSGVIKDKYVTSKSLHHLADSSGFVTVTVQEGGVSCDSGRAVTSVNFSPLTKLIVVIMYNGILFS